MDEGVEDCCRPRRSEKLEQVSFIMFVCVDTPPTLGSILRQFITAQSDKSVHDSYKTFKERRVVSSFVPGLLRLIAASVEFIGKQGHLIVYARSKPTRSC